MATFTASTKLNMKWNGLEISGDAGTTHRIPDAYYEEFNGQFFGLIPGLTWVSTDEGSGVISTHASSATGHAHFSATNNPHSVSAKQIASVHNSADIVASVVQTTATTDTHINATAYDGVSIVTGTYSGGNVWVSHDRGLSWEDQSQLQAGVDDIASIVALSPGVFLAGCSRSGSPSTIHRSTDGGFTWLQVAQPDTSCTEGWALEGGFGRVIIAAPFRVPVGYGPRIYRSTDWGNTWSIVATLETSKQICRKVAHIGKGVYILGAWGSSPNECKVYRSSDQGATWNAVQTLASTDIYEITPLPTGTVLLGTHSQAVIYRSTDIGQTFTSVANLNSGAGQGQVLGIVPVGGHVLAFVNQDGGAASKVYVSDDDGLTWTAVGTPSATYHYHEPVLVEERTLVCGAANNAGTGASAMVRFTFYG